MYINNPHIEPIIIRSLNNEATAEEKNILEIWLRNSAHREEYEEFTTLWANCEDASLFYQFDLSSGWEKIAKGMASHPKKAAVISVKWVKILSIAASIIILTVPAWILILSKKNQQKSEWIPLIAQSNQTITLKDGSRVFLRKGAILRFPSEFGRKTRQLQLSGEAYFEVEHNTEKPFQVTTSNSVITDLGTAFLVRCNDSLVQVVVTSGEVSMESRRDTNKRITLTAKMKGELKNRTLTYSSIAGNNYLAWQTGKLQFDNAPLTTVIEDISHYYQVAVKMDANVSKKKIVVTAHFQDQPLDEVLEELELFTGLNIVKDGSTLHVTL